VSTRSGGISQAAFALASMIFTAPAGLTGIGGTAFLFSLDNLRAGVATAYTGQYTQTVNASVVSGGLQQLGVSQYRTRLSGEIVTMVGSAGSSYATMRNLPQLSALGAQRFDRIAQATENLEQSLGGFSPGLGVVNTAPGKSFIPRGHLVGDA